MVQKGRSRVRLALLVALWALPSGRALADTFQVTKTLDTRDGQCDAHCSLREAIIAANQHPGPDTVMLPAGEYVLQRVGQEDQAAAGDLDLRDDLTLIGAGAESTLIDGNQIDRVFRIHSPAVVLLSGLTIQRGGIINIGTLTLENCTLSGNSARQGGGIYNQTGGTLTLKNCTLSGNLADDGGGGIYNQTGGTLTLENCTLSGNLARNGLDGGGIYNQTGGTLTLKNCTLSGNSAGQGGGGIYNQTGGTLTLENCTLSGNSAGTAGDGIDGKAILENTIIANSPHGRNCSTPLQSNGHNLDDGDGGCGFFNTGNLSGVPANLAPLGNYGGPTQTHALCTGFGMPHPDCTAASPAVDAGANAHCPATDQRGAPRPYGSACDIGAYESGADVVTPGSCQGDCGNDGAVTVNEIITMVNIALGTANVSSCIAGDADGSGDITINEIIAAVNNALTACTAS